MNSIILTIIFTMANTLLFSENLPATQKMINHLVHTIIAQELNRPEVTSSHFYLYGDPENPPFFIILSSFKKTKMIDFTLQTVRTGVNGYFNKTTRGTGLSHISNHFLDSKTRPDVIIINEQSYKLFHHAWSEKMHID